jgi:hypothetical protein
MGHPQVTGGLKLSGSSKNGGTSLPAGVEMEMVLGYDFFIAGPEDRAT